LNNGGLSRARWSGNDEEDSVTFEFHQIVILSEAKNLRLLPSRGSRSKSQRCFASLNMTKGTFASTDRHWLRRVIRVLLGQRMPTQDFELAREFSPVRPCSR
jgi:hypothetical protein